MDDASHQVITEVAEGTLVVIGCAAGRDVRYRSGNSA